MNNFDYTLPVLKAEEIFFVNLSVVSLFSGNYNDAESMLQNGRISQHAFDWFAYFWHFSAWRFSSTKQERYYMRLGVDTLKKRFSRSIIMRDKLLYLLKTNQIKGL